MEFAVATLEYWKQAGFDTSTWRKSIDGTKAIVHLTYAKALIPNVEEDSNVTIYTMPSQELASILASNEWMLTSS